jgi:Raf kinase inhibitor-like YbhB/YbcL family protein
MMSNTPRFRQRVYAAVPACRAALGFAACGIAALVFAAFGTALFGFAGVGTAAAANAPGPFVLRPADAELGMSVPSIYTANAFGCSGGNLSPALEWSGAPPGTESFVLTLFDRDELSTPSGWWHWVVYDLPKNVDRLPMGAGAEHSRKLPPGAQQGRSDLGRDAYQGPCPAKGDAPHRYVFTVYAVNVARLPVPPEASGAMVTSIVQDHLLGKAEFIARYGR